MCLIFCDCFRVDKGKRRSTNRGRGEQESEVDGWMGREGRIYILTYKVTSTNLEKNDWHLLRTSLGVGSPRWKFTATNSQCIPFVVVHALGNEFPASKSGSTETFSKVGGVVLK